jgi:hypothetical protein
MGSKVKEEIEIQRLPMSDGSDLVLTSYASRQDSDRGIFGKSIVTIPHGSVAGLKVGWKRSEWVLILGVILAACWGLVAVAAFSGAPKFLGALSISSGLLRWGLYGLALLAGACFAVFGLWRRRELWIIAAGATIGGAPKNWNDAMAFHDGLYLILRGADPENPEPKRPEEPKRAQRSDTGWEL